MPIEIRELIIKATIQEPEGAPAKGSAARSPEREDIIADCVEQVMALLREKDER